MADVESRTRARAVGSGVLLDVGVYAIAVPYMFYRAAGVPDSDITLHSSVGTLCAAGCDIAGVHTLSYGGGRTAIAHCSWNYMLPNEVRAGQMSETASNQRSAALAPRNWKPRCVCVCVCVPWCHVLGPFTKPTARFE